MEGDRIYYGADSGAFTVTVQAAGLATVAFPETASAGAVYTQGGAYSATVALTYAFTAVEAASGVHGHRRRPGGQRGHGVLHRDARRPGQRTVVLEGNSTTEPFWGIEGRSGIEAKCCAARPSCLPQAGEGYIIAPSPTERSALPHV